ncbi:MAG: hypothetical protein J0L87_00715 [Bacteroidetes bacterium]|nr:hypothetical protein [Bacteroidota bacterium]
MFFQVLITFVFIALFSVLIWRSSFFKMEGVSKIYFLSVFYLKVCIGVFGWMLYVRYYPSNDAIGFFHDGELLYELFFTDKNAFFNLLFGSDNTHPSLSGMMAWDDGYMDFVVNDSRTIVRFNALIRFFSFGVFHVHTIVFCFISLLGSTFIYRAVLPKVAVNRKILLVIVFLAPSVLFWSSLVLKEALVFLAIGMLLYYTEFGMRAYYSRKTLFYSILSTFLLLIIKSYLLLVFLPFLLINMLIVKFKWRRVLKVYALFCGSIVFLIIGVHFISPKHDLIRILQQKQMLFIKQSRGGIYLFASGYHIYVDQANRDSALKYVNDSTCRLKPGYPYKKFILNTEDTLSLASQDYSLDYKIVYDSRPAGSYVQSDQLDGTLGQFLLLIPKKIVSVFLLTDAYKQSGWLICLAVLESSFYLLGLIFVICFGRIKQDQLVLVLFMMAVICSLYSLVGFTSPVIGAIVRYKVVVAPFFGILLLIIFDPGKWSSFRNKFGLKK